MSDESTLLKVSQVGLLIDGIEFIPQDIVEKHLPFATNTKVQAVYVESVDE